MAKLFGTSFCLPLSLFSLFFLSFLCLKTPLFAKTPLPAENNSSPLSKAKKSSNKSPHQDTKTPTIQVGQAQKEKSHLALLPFSCREKEKEKSNSIKSLKTANELANELLKTVGNNLSVSSLFQFVHQKKALLLQQDLKSPSHFLKNFPFQKWRNQNIDFIIQAECEIASKNHLEFKAYLFSLVHKRVLISKAYSSSFRFLRDLAHTFSNDVVFALTKKTSFFQSKIVVSRWNPGQPQKEIFLLDWDGKNSRQMTSHKSISISPTWSWDGTKMAYTSFLYHRKSKIRNADLILYDFTNHKGRIISTLRGINSGAAFHPDGKSIFFTASVKGNPDIFQLILKTKQLKQITNGPFKAINVEPALSPDGTKIAFSSDRGGRPTIYIMDINGKNVRRLVSVGKYNASPIWSPNGQTLAFSGYDKEHFDIFLINANGENLIRLTSAKKANGKWSNNEDPSFSPDGRRILFTSDRSGNKQLYIIHPDGTDERRISFDHHHYERPKWSPFLKNSKSAFQSGNSTIKP